jgi:hypothetical protein
MGRIVMRNESLKKLISPIFLVLALFIHNVMAKATTARN